MFLVLVEGADKTGARKTKTFGLPPGVVRSVRIHAQQTASYFNRTGITRASIAPTSSNRLDNALQDSQGTLPDGISLVESVWYTCCSTTCTSFFAFGGTDCDHGSWLGSWDILISSDAANLSTKLPSEEPVEPPLPPNEQSRERLNSQAGGHGSGIRFSEVAGIRR